jgi:outer membrane immunogenic protein
MRLRFLGASAAAAMLAAATASAADIGAVTYGEAPMVASGVYVDVYGGINWIGSNALDTADFEGAPVAQTFFLDYDEGFVGGIRLGYRYNAHLRADVEYSYRRNTIDELTSPGNIITPGYSFTFETQAAMANGYFDIGTYHGITPYVGGGIGIASVKSFGSIAPGDPGFDYSSRQTTFAAQVRVGATYALTDRLDLGVEYTHFRAFGIDDNLSADFYDTLRKDYSSNSIAALLRVKF